MSRSIGTGAQPVRIRLRLLKGVAVAISLTTLVACAKSPSSIAPTAISSAEYDHLSCGQLNSELSKVDAQLAAATAKQNAAQTMDAVGVFLILIPVSALAGDAEGEVAQYKGEQQAVRRSIEKRNC